MTVMGHPRALLLAGCAAGLSCTLLTAPLPQGSAQAAPFLAQTTTEKASPFAGAKERDDQAHASLKAERGRLWWLLLPLGLAAIGYGALRGREDGEG